MSTITQRVADNLRKQGVTVYERHQWGAQYEDVYAWRRENRPVVEQADTVVQHITVTLDHGPLSGDFKADVRMVEDIGQRRFKTGISYNLLVDMFTGEVAMGQPLDAGGSHTQNDKNVAGFSKDQNYWARAIAVLGMPDYKLSRKARRSIVKILVALMEEEDITTGFDYKPHSFFAWKDCPCDSTRDQMGTIYRQAQRRYKRRATVHKVKHSCKRFLRRLTRRA